MQVYRAKEELVGLSAKVRIGAILVCECVCVNVCVCV